MPPVARPAQPKEDAERLRRLVQDFVRRFGLLVTKQTPCGQPISPSYAHALMLLLERARDRSETSQADLGLVLGIDKSNVARLCSRMEAAGHVAQERAPNDGRSRLVTLTAHGQRLAQRIEKASHERFGHIVASLSREERESIFDSLAALNRAIGALGDPGRTS
jgi:DNA-binding MarR family transcriptional regulator